MDGDAATPAPTRIEVFADVVCPFTHVGLRRVVAMREALARRDVGIRVRAWPLEIVNGAPTSADLVADEVAALRASVAPDLFEAFDRDAFPASSLPALALAARAYRTDLATGERVSLALRTALFEEGRDVGAAEVLAEIAAAHGVVQPGSDDAAEVLADLEEGRERGVIGSPHFFAGGASFFCPSLDIQQVDGRLVIESDPRALSEFLDRCFGAAPHG